MEEYPIFSRLSLREQLVVLNTLELPCGHTTRTCVQIQTGEKVNEDPKDPILHCPRTAANA